MAVLSRQILALFGLRLEQRVHSLLRVFDDQSFFFRSPLTFCRLFRLHQIVLSSRFSIWGMPQPGIGPGSPEWARDCKSRLSASSSTGAQIALDGGTGDRSKCAVPPCFRSSNATLNLFSSCFSLSQANLCNRRDTRRCELSSLIQASVSKAIFLPAPFTEGDHVSLTSQLLKQAVRPLNRHSACSIESTNDLATCYGVVTAHQFLAKQQKENCILWRCWADCQGNDSLVSPSDLVKVEAIDRRILRRRIKGGRQYCDRHIFRRGLWGQLRQGRLHGDEFLKSLKLLMNDLGVAFGLKFILAYLQFQSVGLGHRVPSFLSTITVWTMEVKCQAPKKSIWI
jgi:hypothetical protein